MRRPAALILITSFFYISFVNPVFGGQFEDAVAAYDRGDYATAYPLIKQMAQQGMPGAQFILGLIYDKGQGVPQNDTKAVKWYRKAAEQGLAEAQYDLGVMYATGQGVQQNLSEAEKWFRKAAEQGIAEAQYNLGVMYDQGYGVSQDDSEAVRWYQKSSEQGDVDAQFNLGFMYAVGRGTTKDYILAHMYFNLAVSRFPASEKIRREQALKNRDIVASRMTPAQIAEAQRLAREWKPKGPQSDTKTE